MNTRRCLTLQALAMAALLGAASLAPTPADARPRARVQVWVGGPLWWHGHWGPGYWGPGYWGPGSWGPVIVPRPVVVTPAPEEPLIVPSAPQVYLWYYCRDAQMYYPYVTSCPSPWQEVPATAAPEPADAPAPAEPAAPARTAPAPVPPARR